MKKPHYALILLILLGFASFPFTWAEDSFYTIGGIVQQRFDFTTASQSCRKIPGWEYDRNCNAVKQPTGDGRFISYEFDGKILRSIAFPDENPTLYEYNHLGQLISIVYPGGSSEKFSYVGNLFTFTDEYGNDWIQHLDGTVELLEKEEHEVLIFSKYWVFSKQPLGRVFSLIEHGVH